MPLVRAHAIRSKRGEDFALLEDTALNLVKVRRESKQPGKVNSHDCIIDKICLKSYNCIVQRSTPVND